jgi:hypothetical protein
MTTTNSSKVTLDLFDDIHGHDLFSDVKAASSKDIMTTVPKARDYSPKHELSNRLNLPPSHMELVHGEDTKVIQMLIDSNADKAIRIKRLETVGDSVILHLLNLLNQSETARRVQNEAAEQCITYHKGRIGELHLRVRDSERTVQDLKSRRREQEIDLVEITRSEERKTAEISCLRSQLATTENVAEKMTEVIEQYENIMEQQNRSIRAYKGWTSRYREQLVEMQAVEYDLFLQVQEERRNADNMIQFQQAASNMTKVEGDFNKMLESERIMKG